MPRSRYVIGIDLGTTNTVVAYVDTTEVVEGERPHKRLLPLQQLVAAREETGAPESALPTTVKGLIAARLDALPAVERAVLLAAAVFATTFWRGALERLLPDRDALGSALAELERRDLDRGRRREGGVGDVAANVRRRAAA